MSRHWMKMYWADYLADTMHLSQGQHGAYMLLIAHYWNKGELLAKHCYSIARATTEQERSNVDEVLDQFFTSDGDRWINYRVEHELAEAAESYSRRASAGSKGGKAKAEKLTTTSNDVAMLEQSQSNAEATTKQPVSVSEPESTSNEVDKKQSAYPPEFDVAWDAYPKRPGANKAESFKAWNARVKTGVSAEEMIAGVGRYSAYCRVMIDDPKFIKQPKTFFGPDLHFRSTWDLPPGRRQPASSGSPRTGFDKIDYNHGIGPNGEF